MIKRKRRFSLKFKFNPYNSIEHKLVCCFIPFLQMTDYPILTNFKIVFYNKSSSLNIISSEIR